MVANNYNINSLQNYVHVLMVAIGPNDRYRYLILGTMYKPF